MRQLLAIFAAFCILQTAVLAAPVTPSAKSEAKSKTAALTRSTKPAKISESRALQMISRRPEVRDWKAVIDRAKNKGVSPHVALDRIESGEYVVHVYEDVPDPDGSHTATMNWYYVNMRNGKVRKEF